jgi:hypothetical protein
MASGIRPWSTSLYAEAKRASPFVRSAALGKSSGWATAPAAKTISMTAVITKKTVPDRMMPLLSV